MKAEDSPLRFGIVGLGMGMSHGNEMGKMPTVKLHAVCDINPKRLEEAKTKFSCLAYPDYDAMLKDPDLEAVFIATPSGAHTDFALKAARAGKHLVIEKPMDVSFQRCREVLDACSKSGVKAGVNFNIRFTDQALQIKNAIADGLFGKLVFGEARLKWFRSQEYYDAGGWRGTWKMDGGGSLANQAIHEIDLLRWLMGPVQEVSAARYYALAHKIETEDLGMAMLRFKNGAVGSVLGTTTFPRDEYAGVEIHGTEGAVTYHLGQPARWFFKDPVREQKLRRDFAFRSSAENMAGAVREGHALLNDAADAALSTQLLEAIYQSARENRSIVLA